MSITPTVPAAIVPNSTAELKTSAILVATLLLTGTSRSASVKKLSTKKFVYSMNFSMLPAACTNASASSVFIIEPIFSTGNPIAVKARSYI